MLRLTPISQTQAECVLALDGWLTGQDVALLEQDVRPWIQEGRRLVLDLEGVQSMDPDGIALVRRWVEDGVALRGEEPFIQALLAAHGLVRELASE
jgi:ABC-type transporter Mla MlaB component